MALPLSRVIDGTRIVIQSQTSRPSIDAKLWDVKRNKKFNKLTLTGALGLHGYQQRAPLTIDRGLATALVEVLQCDDRVWQKVELEHCTGELDLIVAAGMATGRVLSFGFAEVNLQPSAYHALATGLKFNRSVSELRIRRCRRWQASLPLDQNESAIQLLSDGLRGNDTIQSLTIEQCSLEDGQLATLVAALGDCASLQKLSLEGNVCRGRCMAQLSTLLRTRKTLKNLSLHNQKLEEGEELDIRPLAEAFVDGLSALKFLDLSRNNLGDDSVSLLAASLVETSILETLHLDQNLITDIGAAKLADSIPEMRALKTLALPENPFGEAGALAILSAMKHNFILEAVIVPSGIAHVQRMIRWYGNLNKGGRRLFSTPRRVALALFPLVIERVNRMRLAHDWNPSNAPAEVIYGLLRFGPVL